ncbi:uncharacterized protein BDZ99DRAFT_193458 [Mytilinidion resinicola]|uniref:Uncharacterized protein n=1 Tax=Mytilinidion resinicola TaxID=574789 RepID=A0A6A6Z2E6_9PEZI|nr:uncharacterized protein BDZ99DRAFT_193458 [Mytilinidion resinicola]KAF2815281.1 hypothetical protein BDZ99DRAFT_193458 [Mytilinidion resinicola]
MACDSKVRHVLCLPYLFIFGIKRLFISSSSCFFCMGRRVSSVFKTSVHSIDGWSLLDYDNHLVTAITVGSKQGFHVHNVRVLPMFRCYGLQTNRVGRIW